MDAAVEGGNSSPDVEVVGLTRRARRKAATLVEIKQHAWTQVAHGGVSAISLRGIAREMGMTSSALYRYFDSQEQLLGELVADGYQSLADQLEQAEAAVADGVDAGEQFMCLTRAYRIWALDHAAQYSLVFGSPICDPADNPRVKEQHWRGVSVLFRSMIKGISSGAIDPSRVPAPSPSLRRQLEQWKAHIQSPLDPQALAGCMLVWSLLHGAISLELFDQLPPPLLPAEMLFDHQMRAALALLGYLP